MPLSQEFAALLADADSLKADLAAAGIPQHCHAALVALHARIESFALAVASLEQPKPDKPTRS